MIHEPTTYVTHQLSGPCKEVDPTIFGKLTQEDVHQQLIQCSPRAFRTFNGVSYSFQRGDYQGHSPVLGDVRGSFQSQIF